MQAHHIPLQHRNHKLNPAFEQDLALALLNGKNLTLNQQQQFSTLLLKALGAAKRAGREVFGHTTTGDLEQDALQVATRLFSAHA